MAGSIKVTILSVIVALFIICTTEVAYADYTNTKTGKVSTWVSGGMYIDLTYNCTWNSKLKCNVFDEVIEVVSYSAGFSLGHDWVQKSVRYEIQDNGRKVKVTVRGVHEYYFIVDGLVKVYENPQTYTYTFTRP